MKLGGKARDEKEKKHNTYRSLSGIRDLDPDHLQGTSRASRDVRGNPQPHRPNRYLARVLVIFPSPGEGKTRHRPLPYVSFSIRSCAITGIDEL